MKEAANEIAQYVSNSFGDRTRIDYGSGHELNFICSLLCLVKLGFFTREDYAALVLKVFYRYIALMRRLQSTYWLEPAGSHGVWGLDDYHFLPFLFGSSQLIEHRHIHPKSIRSNEIVSSFARQYMYLECIEFIVRVKTGSLMEHSPMLVDISGVKTWAKVNEGMLKMYSNELLGKLPVMQHFLFGACLPFTDDPSVVDDDAPEPRHLNVHSFACCGATDHVPSMFAMANATSLAPATSSDFASSQSKNVRPLIALHHTSSDRYGTTVREKSNQICASSSEKRKKTKKGIQVQPLLTYSTSRLSNTCLHLARCSLIHHSALSAQTDSFTLFFTTNNQHSTSTNQP
eukprot:gene17926-21384_t